MRHALMITLATIGATGVPVASADLYMQKGSANADVEQIIANHTHIAQPYVDDQTEVVCRRASDTSFACRWVFDGDSVEWAGHGRVTNVPGDSPLGATRVRYTFYGLHRWYKQRRHAGPVVHHRAFHWSSHGAFIFQQGANH